MLKFIHGSRPAAYRDIPVAWSRFISDFDVIDKGETDPLTAFFGSICSFVASGISVIWQLNGILCGPRHMNVCASETKATQAPHNIVRLHQQC